MITEPSRPLGHSPDILRRLRAWEAIAQGTRSRTLVATLRLATYCARHGDYAAVAPLLVEAAAVNAQAAAGRRRGR